MSVELPKDAEGREIPLNVDALYAKNGERMAIFAWKYIPACERKWLLQFPFDDSDCTHYPEYYYLTPPDSWKKLEEDLDGCIEKSNICAYYSEEDCRTCAILSNDSRDCITIVLEDIKKRIRKLRGEDE